MAIIWLRSAISHNRLRVVYLTLLLPLIIYLCVFVWLILSLKSDWNSTNHIVYSLEYAWYLLLLSSPVLILWLIIWVNLQKSIIFWFTWAKEITRVENPEIYNIVENLCISRWLPVPKIWIIYDDSMNAFATWWNPKSSHIVFSKWLIDKLSKEEIEAVAWHELTHIINWDVKTMVIVNVFIWMIWTIWYILLRSWKGWWNNKKWDWLMILGLILYLVSLLILPLINMAISRKKEFLADAWSVELTKNRDSMINALKKISTDARIEAIDWKWSSVASMFIYSPKNNKQGFLKFFSNLMSTHPAIEERIEMLEKY